MEGITTPESFSKSPESKKFITQNINIMAESDIEEILMKEVPNRNGEGSNLYVEKDSRILGGSSSRHPRFLNALGNYKVPNFILSTWIPYCNGIMCDPSERSYGEFCGLYKVKAKLPAELVEWMGMCGRIREAGIQSFLRARKELASFHLFNEQLDQLVFDIVNVDSSRYMGRDEEKFQLYLEIKSVLDRMGDDADGLMTGEKEEIVSWWRGICGENVVRYQERNWGYAFYLMSALCDDDGDGSPILKGLLDMMEKEKEKADLSSLWANMAVYFMMTFGSVLDAPAACENEQFRKFAKNIHHTKMKLSKTGGKNTLKSMNGLRTLSCASKISFFVDVARKRMRIVPAIKASVEEITEDVRKRKFEGSDKRTLEAAPLWLFDYIVKDFQPRHIAVHLGLDVLFFVCMCLSNADAGGKKPDECYYAKLTDVSEDERKCVKARYGTLRGLSFAVSPAHRAAGAMGQGLIINLRRITTLFERTFKVPEDKAEHFSQSMDDIFADLEVLCTNGDGKTVKYISWTDAGGPMTGAANDGKGPGKQIRKTSRRSQPLRSVRKKRPLPTKKGNRKKKVKSVAGKKSVSNEQDEEDEEDDEEDDEEVGQDSEVQDEDQDDEQDDKDGSDDEDSDVDGKEEDDKIAGESDSNEDEKDPGVDGGTEKQGEDDFIVEDEDEESGEDPYVEEESSVSSEDSLDEHSLLSDDNDLAEKGQEEEGQKERSSPRKKQPVPTKGGGSSSKKRRPSNSAEAYSSKKN